MTIMDAECDDDFLRRVHNSVRQMELLDPRDSWKHTGEPPPVQSPNEYGQICPEHVVRAPLGLPPNLPLTVKEWRARKIDEPDFLCGSWLTTTSRVLVTAATGLGKTNFAIALGQAVSSGAGFLHWTGRRPASVLYIDGEMSARLLRSRLIDEAARQDDDPEYFYALSHSDIPGFAPLNTTRGQDAIEQLVAEIGSVDLIIFDNIMCLIAGDQKETLPWQQTLPWALSLTQRGIGQIWIHHTGHDETRGYGDKAREWQMDTVMHLETAKRNDTDVSFALRFRKARERTPTTRFDFQDVKIALVNDRWEHELTDARRQGNLSPRAHKALEALKNVLASERASMLSGNRRGAHRDDWAAECNARGLIDLKGKARSARTLMNTFRRELVGANRIACEEDLQWLL
ncbi:AAA family ATPase [Bradyrhizobium sp. B120]|uniref:AAA family ATPase n=1 Tax=Bradyrhizobium sp. B120 TaxID=3410088 RepID=UPI003B97D7B5